MSFSTLFFFSFVCVQLISGQCIRNACTSGLYNRYGNMGYGTANGWTSYLPNMPYGSYMPFGVNSFDYGSYGQTLAKGTPNGVFVTSSSPIFPSGVSIYSDNLIMDGTLSVFGQLPVLATVALEGSMYSSGQGAVSYGSGSNRLAGANYFSGYNSGLTNPMGCNLSQHAYRY